MTDTKGKQKVSTLYRRSSTIRKGGFLLCRLLNRVVPEGRSKHALRRFILKFKVYLPREMMINVGDTVIQVGTPLTETIERIMKCLGPSGKAIVIEPDETNVQRLNDHLQHLECQNIIIVKKAAWYEKGQHELLISQKRMGNHRLRDDDILTDNDILEQENGGDYQVVNIDVDTVMNIAIEHHVLHLDYIEIAVNGAEYQVLQGMGNLIECTDRLLVKGHAREKDSGHPINRQIVIYLSNHGFQTFLTKRVPSFSAWGDREGDVYAWK